MMRLRLAAKLPMALYTINIKSGEVKEFYHATDWLNHVQFFANRSRVDDVLPRRTMASDRSHLDHSHRRFQQTIDAQTHDEHDGLKTTRLVNLAKHNYGLEPNMTFTPDQKWIVFRSNMLGPTFVFAVEVEPQRGTKGTK